MQVALRRLFPGMICRVVAPSARLSIELREALKLISPPSSRSPSSTSGVALAEQKTPFRRLRAILFICAGLVLAWQVYSRSFVAYLAEVAPQTALRISPQDPTALLNLADKTLHPRSGTAKEAARAVDLTTKGDGVEGEGVEGEENRLRVWADVAYKAAHRGLSRDADAGSGPSTPPDAPTLDSETVAEVRTWVGPRWPAIR